MKRKLLIFCLCALVFGPAILAPRCGGGGSQPTGGFNVQTQLITAEQRLGVLYERTRQNVPNIAVSGGHLLDRPGVVGNRRDFNGTTNAQALFFVDDGRAPSLWSFNRDVINPCPRQIGAQVEVRARGGTVVLGCLRVITRPVITSFPASIRASDTPAAFTLTGEGFSTTYGMPMVEYFDDDGIFVGQAQSTSVSSDGTQMQGMSPNLSSVYDGTYTLLVSNATADGWEVLSYATVEVYGNPPPDPCAFDPQRCEPCPPCPPPGCPLCECMPCSER